MKRLTVLTTVLLLAAAGCGDDDDESAEQPETTASSSSPAQTCLDSWNADANQDYQTALAGVVSAVGVAPDEFRVGTWPEPERTIPVWSAADAFANKPSGDATVPTDSCVIVVPLSHQGDNTFIEAGGTWNFTRDKEHRGSTFPTDARRSVADAETASADVFGKLTLK